MNLFYDRMFNPQYVNPHYLATVRELMEQKYREEQLKELSNAIKAMNDLCDAVNKLDAEHQQQAFYACLAVLANKLGWQSNQG